MTETTFKDRSGALIFMGVVEILGSLLCLMLAGLMGVTLVFSSEMPMAQMLPALFVYLFLAIWLMVMGIGTLRATRWARTLMLGASWFSFIVGIFCFILMAWVIPQTMKQQNVPQEALVLVMVIMGIMLFTLYLIIPGIGILFYRGRNVQATCERRHPQPCWTDRCPLPVLMPALLLAFSPCSLMFCVVSNFTMPFFGGCISGVTGALVLTIMSAICLALAWGFYTLKPAAWWSALILISIMLLSSAFTFTRIPVEEIYANTDYNEETLHAISQMPEHFMLVITLASTIPYALYLFFIKRYFKQEPNDECHIDTAE